MASQPNAFPGSIKDTPGASQGPHSMSVIAFYRAVARLTKYPGVKRVVSNFSGDSSSVIVTNTKNPDQGSLLTGIVTKDSDTVRVVEGPFVPLARDGTPLPAPKRARL